MARQVRSVARLFFGYVRHARSTALVVVMLGAVFGGTVAGLTMVRDSAEGALRDAIAADVGGAPFALQTGNPAAARSLRRVAGVRTLQDTEGTISSGDLSADASLRLVRDPAVPLGVIVEGRRPRAAGEMVLAQALAVNLDVHIGDRVSVDAQDAAGPIDGFVVGLSVNPASTTATTAVVALPDKYEYTPTMWLSSRDFYDVATLQPFLDRRTATYRSLESLQESAAQNSPQFIGSMRYLPLGAGLLLGVAVIAILGAMSRELRGHAESLQAAGMTQRRSWREIVAILLLLGLIGLASGISAIRLLITAGKVPISGWFDQRWVNVPFPLAQSLLCVLAVTMIAAATYQLVHHAEPVRVRLARWGTRRRVERRHAAIGLMIAGGLWIATISATVSGASDQFFAFARLAALAMLAFIPFTLVRLFGKGLPVATRAFFDHIARSLVPVVAAAAVVVGASGTSAARVTYEANSGERAATPMLPSGAFAISDIPDEAVPALKALYEAEGGKRILRFQIPDETADNLRATSLELVTCMQAKRIANPNGLPDSCFPAKAAAPINTVMLGPAGSEPTADPNLLAQSETLGLLLFPKNQATVSRLASTDAAADSRLGGNLPGLVVPADGTVAKEFDLRPGGSSEVVLLDFAELTPRQQFTVRGVVNRLATGAQTSDGTDPTAYDRLRSVANLYGLLGAAAAALLLVLGAGALASIHTTARRALVDLGASRDMRRGLWLRWSGLCGSSVLLAGLIAITTASLAGQSTASRFGLYWALPAALGVLASFVGTMALTRIPDENTAT